MEHVVFDPVAHAYTVNGERVPGVTSILAAAGLSPDYSQVPRGVLEWARERGRHVDEACMLLDQGRLIATPTGWDAPGIVIAEPHPRAGQPWTLNDEAKPFVDAWAAFKLGTGFVPLLQQPVGYHPELGYCGIPDVIGVDRIVDRKATSDVSRSYGLQLAGYAMGGMQYHDVAPEIGHALAPHGCRCVVHLKKNGTYTVYTDHPDDEAGRKIFHPSDWDTFRAACVIARWKGIMT